MKGGWRKKRRGEVERWFYIASRVIKLCLGRLRYRASKISLMSSNF